MTDHPITPPEELVASMIQEAFNSWGNDCLADNQKLAMSLHVLATTAAQWGANQELEACCKLLELSYEWDDSACEYLRAERRPPASLKQQALEIVRGTPVNSAGLYSHEDVETIRRALEALPDD